MEELKALKTDGEEIGLSQDMPLFEITRAQLKATDPIDPITPMTADVKKVLNFIEVNQIAEISTTVFADFFGINPNYAREILSVINKQIGGAKAKQPVEFIVPHYEGIGLKWVCVVTAEVGASDLKDDSRFLGALRRAVTRWINETERGKAAWKESCQDFNIGDLGNEFPLDAELVKFLADERIFNLDLRSFGAGARHWVHDTHLFDAQDLAEEVYEEEGA